MSNAGTRERSPDGLSLFNQIIRLINIIWYYFQRIWKKYNEIQSTPPPKKMDLIEKLQIVHPPPNSNVTKLLANLLTTPSVFY